MLPFTKNTIPSSIVVSHGLNEDFYDTDGKRYLDFCSQTLNLSLGHAHPLVVSAICEAAQKTTHTSSRFTSTYVKELGEVIFNISPDGLEKINLKVTSGTMANEGALKIAYKMRGCRGVISLLGSHHGQSLDTMRVSGKNFDKNYISRSEVTFFPPCRCLVNPELEVDSATCKCFEPICTEIEANHENIAALILEPIMVDAGVIIPTRRFLQRLRECTSKYGIILIFDEVQTGFGWTGHMFASNYFGVVPDILTVSKGFAAGLPLGAIMLRKELDILDYGEHEITHGANPIACAAALANIRLLSESNLLIDVQKNGKYLLECLHEFKRMYTTIQHVRGIGLVIGVDFFSEEIAELVYKLCLQNGLVLRRSKVGENASIIQFKPPLTTSRESITEAMEIFGSVLKDVS